MDGEQIGGLAGVFFSIPVIAMLRILLLRIARAREIEEETAPASGEEIAAGPGQPQPIQSNPA